jgi:hypothetical protein
MENESKTKNTIENSNDSDELLNIILASESKIILKYRRINKGR